MGKSTIFNQKNSNCTRDLKLIADSLVCRLLPSWNNSSNSISDFTKANQLAEAQILGKLSQISEIDMAELQETIENAGEPLLPLEK
jgi:hypothetical protein